MEGLAEVDLAEDGAAGDLVDKISKVRKREIVQFGLEIKKTIIPYRAEESVAFWSKMQR